jgi:hypothetical protein
MLRTDFLPAEFEPISHLVSYAERRSRNEFHSSCPQCGGSEGNQPHRFVMFLISKYGFPMGFCRVCGYRWTAKNGKEPTREQIEEWRRNQIEVEKARIEYAQRALELLQNDKVWERFYLGNNEWSKGVFREWGISDSWIDYLRLGLMPDYLVKHGEEAYHSPAATIPVWNVGGVVQNIKIRVLNPKTSADRYRNFYAMGSSFLFVPLYDLPLCGAGVVVEGEKKAIVLEQTLNNPSLRVVGLGSKSASPTIFAELKNLDPVYVWLDPDAFQSEGGKESAVDRTVRLLGKERVRIVNCPIKVDDGIVKYDLNPRSYLRMAQKPR